VSVCVSLRVCVCVYVCMFVSLCVCLKKRILTIEDDPVTRRVLKVRLENKGYEVVELENGPDAVAFFSDPKETPVDLIICDVMMPGMDGYEVCRTIREIGVGVPFLFLSSKVSSDDKVRGVESGADDYITKPFDPHELEAKVAARLRRT